MIHLQGKLGQFQGKMIDLQGKLGQFQGKMIHLHGKLGQFQGKMIDLHGKLGQFQGKMIDLHGKLGQFQSKMIHLQGKLGQFQGKMIHLHGKAGQFYGKMVLLYGKRENYNKTPEIYKKVKNMLIFIDKWGIFILVVVFRGLAEKRPDKIGTGTFRVRNLKVRGQKKYFWRLFLWVVILFLQRTTACSFGRKILSPALQRTR